MPMPTAAPTPKALIHQKYGAKACYRVEEVREAVDGGCPGLALPQQTRSVYRCALDLRGLAVVTPGTFVRKKDAEQAAAQIALDKCFALHQRMYVFPWRRLLEAQHGGGRHLESLHLLSVSMKQLQLQEGGAAARGAYCLPNLKRLELAFSDVDEPAVRRLLSACHGSLEWLRFEDCQSLRGLAVRHLPLPRLRHFAADDCLSLRQVDLRAPALASFRFAGAVDTRVLLLPGELQRLAALDVMHQWRDRDVFDYVNGLPSRTPLLRSLSVCTRGFFKAVEFPNKLMHLRYLRLSVEAGDTGRERGSQRERKDILRLALFLEAAPFLELFVLHMKSGKRTQYDDDAEPCGVPINT